MNYQYAFWISYTKFVSNVSHYIYEVQQFLIDQGHREINM